MVGAPSEAPWSFFVSTFHDDSQPKDGTDLPTHLRTVVSFVTSRIVYLGMGQQTAC